jgi:hypothetical protein
MRRRWQVAAVLETKRLGNGVVQRAVIGVLAAADRALTVADVQGGVEERLGRPVSLVTSGGGLTTSRWSSGFVKCTT